MAGERFQRLDQLKAIKRVDWDEIFKENLVALIDNLRVVLC
jgi:hypothetical protein